MIQIVIRQDDPLGQFIEARASQSGRTQQAIAEEVVRDSFYALLQLHYEQFMRGEISQGRMAELLGISRTDLIHLLDRLGWQVTNL